MDKAMTPIKKLKPRGSVTAPGFWCTVDAVGLCWGCSEPTPLRTQRLLEGVAAGPRRKWGQIRSNGARGMGRSPGDSSALALRLCGQALSTSCHFPSRPGRWALSVLLCSIGMSYTKEHMNSDTVPPVVTLCPMPPWVFPWLIVC